VTWSHLRKVFWDKITDEREKMQKFIEPKMVKIIHPKPEKTMTP